MSVPAHEESPAVTRLHPAHAGRRRALVVAAVAVALITVAVLKPWQGPTTPAAVVERLGSQLAPSPPGVPVTPPAATVPPGPTPSPTESPAVALAARRWGLDFMRSGIQSLVCLNRDGRRRRCLGSGDLGSSLRFRDGQISGGTGVGGGCDEFAGTYSVDASSLRISVPTYSSRCWESGVDLSIRVRLDHVARFVVGNGTLTLIDAEGKVLLVYRR